MPKTAFVTDTNCSLPADIAARYHIQQVPITVQFGELELVERIRAQKKAWNRVIELTTQRETHSTIKLHR